MVEQVPPLHQRRSCMLNFAENNITPEDDNRSSVIDFISKKNIICTKQDWINMDREEAVRKDCADRKKSKKPLGSNSKYVWFGIGVATTKHISNFQFPSLAKIFN